MLLHRFPPELILEVIDYIKDDSFLLENGFKSRQDTLTSSCLVTREWNRLFTPFLYRNIVLDDNKSASSVRLLFRTLSHTGSLQRGLIQKVSLTLTPQPRESIWLLISLNLPNLLEVTLNCFDYSNFYSTLPQYLRSLSKRCIVVLNPTRGGCMSIGPESICRWARFLRTSQPSSCEIDVAFKESRSDGKPRVIGRGGRLYMNYLF